MEPSALLEAERMRSHVMAAAAEATRSDFSQYFTLYHMIHLDCEKITGPY